MNISLLKSICYKILIGALIAVALVAVVAVLIGDFSDTLQRVLWMIALVVVHSFLALGYISSNAPNSKSLRATGQAGFYMIIASYAVSVLGVWEIIDGTHVWNTYVAFLVVLFAAFHGDALALLLKRQKLTDYIIYANYAFMVVVAGMLITLIYADGADLGVFFGRLLGAAAIIDGTLTLLAVIFDAMYTAKHPKAPLLDASGNPLPKQQSQNRGVVMIVVGIAVIVQIMVSFGGFLFYLF